MINGKERRGFRKFVDWTKMRSNMFSRHRVVWSIPWGDGTSDLAVTWMRSSLCCVCCLDANRGTWRIRTLVIHTRWTLIFWDWSFTFNSNKSPTWCNNFSVYYPDVCLQLNMFRAFSCPLSGAQWLQWQPLALPSYRGDGRDVFVVGSART
jgi:hypothetical protein